MGGRGDLPREDGDLARLLPEAGPSVLRQPVGDLLPDPVPDEPALGREQALLDQGVDRAGHGAGVVPQGPGELLLADPERRVLGRGVRLHVVEDLDRKERLGAHRKLLGALDYLELFCTK